MSMYDVVYKDSAQVRGMILDSFTEDGNIRHHEGIHQLPSGVKVAIVSELDAVTVMALIPSEVVKGFGVKGCCSSTLAGLMYMGADETRACTARLARLLHSVEVTYLPNDGGFVLRIPVKP